MGGHLPCVDSYGLWPFLRISHSILVQNTHLLLTNQVDMGRKFYADNKRVPILGSYSVLKTGCPMELRVLWTAPAP